MSFKPQGIISAMVTPFTKNGEFVDLDRVGPVAERLVKGGVHGLFPCGTTGEGFLLAPDERMDILEEVVKAVGKKATVIAQTGGCETATVIELTRHAQECGAHGAAIVAPGYYAYDDLAIKAFYTTIAKAVKGFPIMMYNIPSCARNALSAELILDLANSVENIVGLKDSSGNMGLITRLLGNAPKGFYVVNGADEYGFQALVAGCSGVVSGTSNVWHEIYLSVYNNVKKGNQKQAWKDQIKLERLCRVLQYGRNIAIFKEGMRMRGFDPGYVRPPQRELTAAEKKWLAQELSDMGVI
jgi:dihydrodipicolinate synthase/N-acetylneuraminate lyase